MTRAQHASSAAAQPDQTSHPGGGVLIAEALFTVTGPRSFFVFVTIPCALLPGVPDLWSGTPHQVTQKMATAALRTRQALNT